MFGVNDGLVSNAALILGIAGASSDPRVCCVTGVAGLVAGAFSMAAGEYVSVRSQRELYEHQIALERDELEQYPEAEAQELALIYAAKGVPAKEAARIARKLVADPEHALDTLAREELGLNPAELGSPVGCRGELVPRVRGRRADSARRRAARCAAPRPLPAIAGVTAVALFGIGALLSLFTGRSAVRSGLRMLALGGAAALVTHASALGRARLRRRSRSGPDRCTPSGAPVRVRAAPRVVTLAPGREKSLRHRHPWIFSGAIARVEGHPGPGETVEVRAHDGSAARAGRLSRRPRRSARASGRSSPRASIAAFFAARVQRGGRGARRHAGRAPHRRAGWCTASPTACRASSPTATATTVVLQLLSAGAERVARRDRRRAVARATGARCVVERSDADVRTLEGLAAAHRRAARRARRARAAREAGLVYEVDVLHGQKTGFYLDQRDNRRSWATHARGAQVLNAFCYTGGFSLAALAGGAARVLSIDSSADALRRAQANLARNPSLAGDAHWLEADVFAELRTLREAGRTFDLIVLDPPKFAPTAKHAPKAARAYKDINLRALQAAAPRRAARDVQLLGRRVRGPLPEDRGRRGARREGGCVDRGPARGERRPPGRAHVPRRRLPQGLAAAQALNAGTHGGRRRALGSFLRVVRLRCVVSSRCRRPRHMLFPIGVSGRCPCARP